MSGRMQTRKLQAASTGQYSLSSVVAGSVREESDVGVLASTSDDEDVVTLADLELSR